MRRMVLSIGFVAAFAAGVGTMWLLQRSGDPPAAAATAKPGMQTDATGREVLYWYDPMLPQHHFDAPGKSPFMDMMLVPRYADEAGDDGSVSIDPRLVQNLGVRTAQAVLDRIDRRVTATGVVAFDERAVSVVQARVPAIVERLHVRAVLDPVRAGQPLITLIAPEWTAAQEEYLALRRAQGADAATLADAARRRLQLLGMTDARIRAIERRGRSDTLIVLTAPRDGVLTELAVREGAGAMPGMPLMRINGIDTVWVNAAVPEADAGRIARGAAVSARIAALPGETFAGSVEALLPQVDPATRTLTARIVLDNPHGALSPGMFATLELTPADAGPRRVLVPREAVIATGTRHVVIVALGDGRFRAQEVEVGLEAGGRSEILEGLDAGESIVLSGQFLIDSEASLSGALARLDAAGDGDAAAAAERHDATGVVARIAADGWTIDTDPIPSLRMGAMPMTFVPPAAPPRLAVGQRVQFTFFTNADDAFEIERIAPAAGDPP